MYKEEEGRGVRSSKIRTQKFSLPPSATLDDVLKMGKEAFFSELDIPLRYLHLVDSSGLPIETGDEDWTLGKYFEKNGYQPSRHKLYVMFKEPLVYNIMI